MKLIGIAAIIIALSVGYYFIFYLPQKDAQVQLAQAQQKYFLQTCLSNSSANQRAAWKKECEQGLGDNKSDNCGLPIYISNSLNDAYQKQKDDCFKQYPQK